MAWVRTKTPEKKNKTKGNRLCEARTQEREGAFSGLLFQGKVFPNGSLSYHPARIPPPASHHWALGIRDAKRG